MAKGICLVFLLLTSLFQPYNMFAQEDAVGGNFGDAPILFIDKTTKPGGLAIDVLAPNLLGLIMIWKVYEKNGFNYMRSINMIKIVIITTTVLFILVFMWVWLLRLQIKKKTESINIKNQELQKSEEKFRNLTENSSDISERKKAELQLKEQESQLRELNSTKDKLFLIIAHDLRGPFNAILGFSELLMNNIKDFEVAESEKYLETINSSTKNTLILLDNLLTWAKAQTGEMLYQPERTYLSAILCEILEVSKPISEIKNISISYIQTDDFEIYADVNMLKTILRNLISNAVKYTHPNGKVAISAVQKQNNIVITVSDNGVGMSEETQIKLFEIDTNNTTIGTANEKGSGLGLILCKEFTEKHGGEIWVKSELGRGSDFVFSLPLRSH